MRVGQWVTYIEKTIFQNPILVFQHLVVMSRWMKLVSLRKCKQISGWDERTAFPTSTFGCVLPASGIAVGNAQMLPADHRFLTAWLGAMVVTAETGAIWRPLTLLTFSEDTCTYAIPHASVNTNYKYSQQPVNSFFKKENKRWMHWTHWYGPQKSVLRPARCNPVLPSV